MILVVYNHFFPNDAGNQMSLISDIIIEPLFILSLVIAIVGCHRIFLKYSTPEENNKLFRWTGNEIRYIGWWLLIGIVISLISIPVVLLVMPILTNSINDNSTLYPLLLFIGLPIFYVASRWSMVLPASAIDIKNKTLTWSWDMSKDNGWRLTLLISILPFFFDTIFEFLPHYDSIVYSLFVGMGWLIIGVIEIGLLSLSYEHLSKLKINDLEPDKMS